MADKDILKSIQNHLDNLTKPKGSLGDLEDYATRLALIQGRVPPKIERKIVLVFASDHGVAGEGVSLYPQEVTAQMVQNFLGGGAAVNVLARRCAFDLRVIDAGVIGELPTEDRNFEDAKIRHGGGNIAREDAMSAEECDAAVAKGKDLADWVAAEGYDLVALGDMGIGNTTVAAALLGAMGFSADQVVDRGTGIDEATLARKREVVEAAISRGRGARKAKDIVRILGGPDFAMIMGFLLGLRGRGITCVLDGFPISAAAYLAFVEDAGVGDFLFAGHRSKVRGHRVVLEALGLTPIVDFRMRLGEGTGAVIGGKILELAASLAAEMASFSSAHVSESTANEENY